MQEDQKVDTIYIGPPGAGLGFQMSGMSTVECVSGEEVLDQLKKQKNLARASIVFVDEVLAEGIMDEVELLQENRQLVIVLLPNPIQQRRLAAKKMDRLMIKAVGSDIFSN